MKNLLFFTLLIVSCQFAFSQSEQPQEKDRRMIIIEGWNEPLSSDNTIENIVPDNIKKMVIINKEETAKLTPYIKKYGNRAKEGVIILTLKDKSKGVELKFDKPQISKRKFPNSETGEADTAAVYIVCNKRPQFLGGDTEMYRFISANYSKEVKENITKAVNKKHSENLARFRFLNEDMDGRLNIPRGQETVRTIVSVTVEIVVETNGTFGNFRIKRSNNATSELEQEAIRIIKLMPAFEPAEQDGQPVRALKDIMFRFVNQTKYQ